MRISTKLLTGAAAMAMATPAQAGEEVLFGPVPDWVTPYEIPRDGNDASGEAGENTAGELAGELPVRIRLTDNQVMLEPGRRTTFVNFALNIQTPQGLSAGNLSLPWRPEMDEMTVHQVLVRRGDEVIDVLDEGQTFTVLRREQSLEQATLDGVLTANMFPAGLEVGDTLEVSYSLVSENPVLANTAEVVLGPYNAPFQNAHVLVRWPEDIAMQLSATRGLPELQRRNRGGFDEASFTMRDVDPLLSPSGAPPRFSMVRLLEASSFASWQEVASLFVPLYEEASQIAPEGRLRQKVEEIREATSDPRRRAEMALDLVQDQVRYVALAMGTGGLAPANTAETWARRYGDCKAKTALLLGMLHELGIEAVPVTVNSALGDSIPGRLPMVGVFDHILVRATIDSETFWLDGTRSSDTTLDRLVTPNFVWGLPIIAQGAELVSMVPSALQRPLDHMTIRIDASNGLFALAAAEVELLLTGNAAISTNAVWSQIIGDARSQTLEQYWREEFDFITQESTTINFDADTGEMRFTMSGSAQMDWSEDYYETDNTRVGYRADFTRADGPESDAPFAVPHPFYELTTQIITLPEGFTEDMIDGEEFDEVVGGIEYQRAAQLDGNVFTATRSVRSVATEFAAAEADQIEQRLGELWTEHLHLKLPASYRMSPADVEFAIADTPTDEDANFFVDRAVLLMASADYDAAIVDLDKALAVEPNNVWAFANRGLSLAQLRRTDEALADFDRADAASPGNPVALRGRGLLAAQNSDHDEAIDFFTQSLDAEPDSAFTNFQRALAYFGKEDHEAALRDTEQAIKRDPDYFQPYTLRIVMLMELDREEEAAASVEEMLAIFPGEAFAQAAASELLLQMDREERSTEILTEALEQGPNPMALYSMAMRREIDETDQKLAELTQALEIEPEFLPALFERSHLYWMEYEYRRAIADADRAIEIAPDQPRGYELKAKALIDLNRRTEAGRVVDTLVEANPEQPAAFSVAVRIHRQLGNLDTANELLDRQLALGKAGPGQVEALLNRADQRDLDDLDGREEDITAALALDGDNFRALFYRADLDVRRGNFGSAAQLYSRIIEAEDEDYILVNALGMALQRAGRDGEATDAFDRALELALEDAAGGGLNNICWNKVLAGVALDRALDECNRSLNARPDFAPTLDSRGMAYLRLERNAEAIADFDRALAQMPSLASSLFGRAIAHARSSNVQAAREDARQARRLQADIGETFSAWGVAIPEEIAE